MVSLVDLVPHPKIDDDEAAADGGGCRRGLLLGSSSFLIDDEVSEGSSTLDLLSKSLLETTWIEFNSSSSSFFFLRSPHASSKLGIVALVEFVVVEERDLSDTTVSTLLLTFSFNLEAADVMES